MRFENSGVRLIFFHDTIHKFLSGKCDVAPVMARLRELSSCSCGHFLECRPDSEVYGLLLARCAEPKFREPVSHFQNMQAANLLH